MTQTLCWITNYSISKSRRSPHTNLRNYLSFVDGNCYIDLDSLLLYIHGIVEDLKKTTDES
jgi:hypothetical protein